MTMLLELEDTTRLYGTVIGVNDISLSLGHGAYGLLGPNGAGKTTLLNLITGQLKPTLGSVRVLGQDPRNNASLMARLGFLPGSEGMYANVSAFDWVTYLTELHNRPHGQAQELAARALATLGMSEHMHRPIAHYSRGMRQRTRLAQAIAHDPEMLVLDEPFSGLDPIGRHEMSTFLRSWIEQGRSLILASHVLHEIESITRSFLLICGGRLLASGSADDIHEILADIPSQIQLTTDTPRQLAAELIAGDLAESVRVENATTVVVTTSVSLKLFSHLTGTAGANGAVVTGIRSADESLQEVFHSLMRIHRGEM